MKGIIIFSALLVMISSTVFANTLDGYDRAKLADENYRLANGDAAMKEAANDPELAAVMKKYLYADIVKQAKITQTERKLIEIVVLTTNQNHKFISRVAGEALNLGVKPLEIREALYHVAPYIGFPKVFEALDVVNEVFTAHGIKLPLENQGTTTDTDRFEKGLAFQVGAYGERINQ
ncbi:MAG: carboxymuconolactone decarboxylase family protein, partial [Synergistaceae bacterium]|nr:carboxymuconolactone decarboxylase family protein [Synergistaceae bacterium]